MNLLLMKQNVRRRRWSETVASKKELEALIVLAGKIDPSLQKALKDAGKQTKQFNKEAGMIGKTFNKSIDIAKKAVAAGTIAVGAALAYVGKKGIDFASDLNEVQNVVDVTFGDSAKQIDDWSKTTLKSYGLSELAAKQYTGTIGAMLKSSGIANEETVTMSKNLTALAGDFASFYNLDADEAFNKIRSGISGETEPLKQLGINMSVANLEAYALSKGIDQSWNSMDQATQTMLRYNYLLEVSKDAQGDFTRTNDEYANQQRMFKENLKQLSATIMKAALPALTKFYQKGNELMTKFAGDEDKIARLQEIIENVFNKIIDGMPSIIEGAKKFGSVMVDIFSAAYKVYQFVNNNWVIIKPMVYGIVASMVAWKIATLGMSVYKGIMLGIKGSTLAASFAYNTLRISKLKDAAATVYLHTLYAKDAILKGTSTAATWTMNAAHKAARIGTLAAAAAQWALNAAILANPITWIVIAIIAAIGLLIAAFYYLYKNWDKVSAFLSNSWEMIKHGFAVGVNWIVDKINWLIEKMNKIPGVNIPLIPKMDTSSYDAAAKANSSGSVRLEKFASGGFANRPSIFGDAGPEAAIPLKRTPRSLSLLDKTAQLLGVSDHSGQGGSPTFIFAPNYGNGGPVQQQMQNDFEEFKKMLDEWWESKRRESFA